MTNNVATSVATDGRKKRHEYSRWLADFLATHVLPFAPAIDISDYCALAEAFYPLLPISYLWTRGMTNVVLGEAFRQISFEDQKKTLHSGDLWCRADDLARVAMTVEMIAAARGCQRVVKTLHRRHYHHVDDSGLGSADEGMIRACASRYCSDYGLEILWKWFRDDDANFCSMFCAEEEEEEEKKIGKSSSAIAKIFRTPGRMNWLLGQSEFEAPESIRRASGDLLLEAVERGLTDSVRLFFRSEYAELVKPQKLVPVWFLPPFAGSEEVRDLYVEIQKRVCARAYMYRAAVLAWKLALLYPDSLERERIAASICEFLLEYETSADVILGVFAAWDADEDEKFPQMATTKRNGAMAAFEYVVDASERTSPDAAQNMLTIFLAKKSKHSEYGEVDPLFHFGARYLVSITNPDIMAACEYRIKKLIAQNDFVPRTKLRAVRECLPAIADFMDRRKQLALEQVGFRKRRRSEEENFGSRAQKKIKTTL